MTRDQEFLQRWDREKVGYEAFGQFVAQEVRTKLRPLTSPIDVDYFLRTATRPRLKDADGLVAKAFYRGKNYPNPYDDITDKVGVRFVVLLGSDIKVAEEALMSVDGLEFSKDRDYEEEQNRNPISFDYAAVHYVVRCKSDLDFGGVGISAGTPCEVQIKTLLQHAYSELTHDTIYKPQIQATSEMKRDAAKAMALLEATNDYFEKVSGRVANIIGSLSEVTTTLSEIYRKEVGFAAEPTILEGLILDGYDTVAEGEYALEVEKLIAEKPFLVDRVKERVSEGNPIFKQPSIWLVYLDIVKRGQRALENWRLTDREIEPLLNDLGESAT
ncbi:RelA/SpoT domain-containing protein [Qipengyuania sp. XHP0207]|uniref:GTP pyrophosphokinase n=1 Tax=Qipengyuania sp. XHP0207 TaxID=3038078 RepID=UPI00241FBA6B|nr:RelA/SpoT domain-containing protein [Qipengyuania sp. XHP0207]MDG5747166.1 RelA/SpoT domain-containing protein [Qipengyuania sp. XHP0207]